MIFNLKSEISLRELSFIDRTECVRVCGEVTSQKFMLHIHAKESMQMPPNWLALRHQHFD